MENGEYQKELFEFEKPKRTFLRLGRIFRKADMAVTLTLEKLVFVLIGFIMTMVIVYAIGVERGRSIGKTATLPIVRKAVVAPITQEAVSVAIPSEKAAPETRPYTIAAVTLSRKDVASLEANRLKKEGFDAFVVQNDSYFLVCIGAYPDKDSAQSKRTLSKVRQIYKDAYFKLR